MNNETAPIPTDAFVAFVNRLDDVLLKNPTKVDSTIVGIVIQLLELPVLASAFLCSQARPEHFSASSAISFSKDALYVISYDSSDIYRVLIFSNSEQYQLCH